jgi:hypothetical protein
MNPRPDGQESMVLAERKVPAEGRYLEMPGIEVKEDAPLEHR